MHLQVVTAGAVSFTMVYEGLEQGAKIVLTGSPQLSPSLDLLTPTNPHDTAERRLPRQSTIGPSAAGARDSASGIAGHKYGPDAGQVTGDMMASVGHTANAYTSYRNIAVRL
jgi:Senescence-associated protein